MTFAKWGQFVSWSSDVPYLTVGFASGGRSWQGRKVSKTDSWKLKKKKKKAKLFLHPFDGSSLKSHFIQLKVPPHGMWCQIGSTCVNVQGVCLMAWWQPKNRRLTLVYLSALWCSLYSSRSSSDQTVQLLSAFSFTGFTVVPSISTAFTFSV